MYNKPITQRVASARSKKPSALKQTEDTTVLKTEIPIITDKSTKQLPDTTKVVKTKRKKTWDDLRAEGMNKDEIQKAKDWRKKNPDAPNVGVDDEEEITVKGGTEEVETPRYQYDYGDSMPSYMQRKYYRGLKVGERQTKKALKAQLKAGSISKDEYKQGLAEAATQRATASKDFAETQAEAARQGQMFGKKGTTKIGTFDPNVRVSGEDDAVGRVTTKADVSNAEEKMINQKKNKEKLAAIEAERNKDAVNKRNEQEEVANKDIKTVAEMKVGPLKMKSSFKMGGYGSKTYKK